MAVCWKPVRTGIRQKSATHLVGVGIADTESTFELLLAILRGGFGWERMGIFGVIYGVAWDVTLVFSRPILAFQIDNYL